MDVFSWKNFLLPYEYAVEELKIKFKDIRKELKETDSYSPIEFVTGRVKKISSIIDRHQDYVPVCRRHIYCSQIYKDQRRYACDV